MTIVDWYGQERRCIPADLRAKTDAQLQQYITAYHWMKLLLETNGIAFVKDDDADNVQLPAAPLLGECFNGKVL